MILCPIASAADKDPYATAVVLKEESISYQRLHEIVNSSCSFLSQLPHSILAFIPQRPGSISVEEIAFLFAAWRSGKTLYPISFRLSDALIAKRVENAHAFLINPLKIVSSFCSKSKEELNPDLLATYIETSGSSFEPKLICHTLKSHFLSASSAVEALSLFPGDRYLLNLPLHHISGLAIVLRTFLARATLLLSSSPSPTHLSMVPTQLFRSLDSPTPSLKVLLMGGAPLSLKLKQRALAARLPLKESYGMTETSAMAVLEGMALPHIELMLCPETSEIFFKSEALFFSYFGQPHRDPHSFFATHDLGKIDLREGRLEIWGRKDRQFISGGENIQPEEVERALLTLDDVLEARVYPIADEEFGAKIGAKITVEKDYSKDREESMISLWKEELTHLLARFKIPTTFTLQTTSLEKKLSN